MNKGLKVLSAVLTMSMVLASGVFAVDANPEWTKDELDLLKKGGYGFALSTETKEVKKEVLYKELVDDDFKASLKEYDKALEAVGKDAKTIQALGDARCQAQFDLDSANNQILATRKFMDLAQGIEHVSKYDTHRFPSKDGKYEKPEISEVYKVPEGNYFAADAKKLNDLIKENKKFTKMTAEELNQAQSFLGVQGEKNGDLAKANYEELQKAVKKYDAKYFALVAKVEEAYGGENSLRTSDTTVSGLTTKAKVATAKINLINDLAEKYKVTLRACSLADYTAKASGKAAAKKDAAKKDDVPNTASYFTIYVPTCEFAAPAVKYYGAAQVYEKALRRPLVCKKVETKTVEVPRFTFDELTAYDVACCCCK
ncbi:hypothetical protein HMPREF0868_0057 [Mageeibacillus indolicus UPII9-5]|uniref:Uncharacterized protein n=1 Tax=Mageeibacillus indolicus (strain UPII9-5) TaxID=699246 RepID=D3QZQ6_MAGIU|nr:hypothetical protein [Mageeibacillus indolicus]ADC90837.1 hypothetical protein HMPREF0868_0057 [Mageeibacillus indolicus UPII9-5]